MLAHLQFFSSIKKSSVEWQRHYLYSTTFLYVCRIILVKAWSLSHHFGESLSSWINEVHDYILWWRGTSLTNTSAKKKCKAAALTIFYIHIQSLIQKVDMHLLSALSQLFHTIFVKLNQTCKFVHINILRGGKIDTYFQSFPFPLLITL